jgi:hypothetical protein
MTRLSLGDLSHSLAMDRIRRRPKPHRSTQQSRNFIRRSVSPSTLDSTTQEVKPHE